MNYSPCKFWQPILESAVLDNKYDAEHDTYPRKGFCTKITSQKMADRVHKFCIKKPFYCFNKKNISPKYIEGKLFLTDCRKKNHYCPFYEKSKASSKYSLLFHSPYLSLMPSSLRKKLFG